MGWTIWDLNCGGRKRVFFVQNIEIGFGSHLTSFSLGTGFFLGVKEPGLEVNDSLPSSAEVKNEGSYTLHEKNCLQTTVYHPKIFVLWNLMLCGLVDRY